MSQAYHRRMTPVTSRLAAHRGRSESNVFAIPYRQRHTLASRGSLARVGLVPASAARISTNWTPGSAVSPRRGRSSQLQHGHQQQLLPVEHPEVDDKSLSMPSLAAAAANRATDVPSTLASSAQQRLVAVCRRCLMLSHAQRAHTARNLRVCMRHARTITM